MQGSASRLAGPDLVAGVQANSRAETSNAWHLPYHQSVYGRRERGRARMCAIPGYSGFGAPGTARSHRIRRPAHVFNFLSALLDRAAFGLDDHDQGEDTALAACADGDNITCSDLAAGGVLH